MRHPYSRVLTLVIAALLAVTTRAIGQQDLHSYEFLVGSWQGELEYLDYGDNQTLVSLPTQLSVGVTDDASALTLEFSYREPDGRVERGTERLVPTADGLYLGDRWDIQERSIDSKRGIHRLVLERDGEDGGRSATIWNTVIVDNDALTITKVVGYHGADETLQRHQYRLRRDNGHAALRQEIDSIIAPYLAARDFMGVVGVQRDGEQPLIVPYGLANVELDAAHTPSSVFMIGSVSKQFTGVAILLLEAEGLLRTGDLVSQHLPEFAHGPRITIEQLLNHTSGVVDVYSLPRMGASAGQRGTFDEVLDDLGKAPLTFEPGSGYAYSNGGYVVLAAIIEAVSGTSYEQYLQRTIFAPLGMRATSHDAPRPATANRVSGYDPWGGTGLTPAIAISAAYSTGPGSLWSSARDLLTWSAALHTGRVLSNSAYAKFTRDYGAAYGFGVSVFSRFGRPVIGHDGRIDGFASDLARYVDDSLTVVILSNVQSVARDQIRTRVAAAVLDEPYSIPVQQTFLTEAAIPLDEMTGVYSFGPGFSVSITARDGRLMARANEGGASELVPVNDTEWFSRMLYATVRFGHDETGSIDRLIWGRGENAPVGQRVR